MEMVFMLSILLVRVTTCLFNLYIYTKMFRFHPLFPQMVIQIMYTLLTSIYDTHGFAFLKPSLCNLKPNQSYKQVVKLKFFRVNKTDNFKDSRPT